MQLFQERKLQIEREKSDILLRNMLPPAVANALREGTKIDPTTYEAVTMFFSDVKGTYGDGDGNDD